MSFMAPEPAGEMVPRAEHVWVTDLPNQGAAPGLLLGWRRRQDDGWEGWCIVAQLGPTGTGPAEVTQRWVRAEAIRRREV